MAISLKLNSLQANDTKSFKFTDNTGAYSTSNTGGWGSPNIAVTAINGTTHTLELGIRIVTPSSDVTYAYINLYALSGPFTAISDLEFDINCSHLLHNSSPLGTVNDTFPDGLYYLTYILDRGLSGEVSADIVMFVDGNVRNATYNKLRTIPTTYLCKGYKNKDIDDAIMAFAYLIGMESTSYVAKTEELINNIPILQRLVLYGCNNSW